MEADDVMEIEPLSSWEDSEPPQLVTECIDMTSDDDAPIVIDVMDRPANSACELLMPMLMKQAKADGSSVVTTKHSDSNEKKVSTAPSQVGRRRRSSANTDGGKKIPEETSCIEIDDDDISICDSSSAYSKVDSSSKTDETESSTSSNPSNETPISQSVSQSPSPANETSDISSKTYDRGTMSPSTAIKNVPAKQPPIGRVDLNSSDQNCEMVILTDDESMPENKEEKQASEKPNSLINCEKSVVPELISDNSNEKVKSLGEQLSETSEQNLTEKSCEMVILTDDEYTQEDQVRCSSLLKPLESTKFSDQASIKVGIENLAEKNCNPIFPVDDKIMPEEKSESDNSAPLLKALYYDKSSEPFSENLSGSTNSSDKESVKVAEKHPSNENDDMVLLTDDEVMLVEDSDQESLVIPAKDPASDRESGVDSLADDSSKKSDVLAKECTESAKDVSLDKSCEMIILTDDENMTEENDDEGKCTQPSDTTIEKNHEELVTASTSSSTLRQQSTKTSKESSPDCFMINLTDDIIMSEDKNSVKNSSSLSKDAVTNEKSSVQDLKAGISNRGLEPSKKQSVVNEENASDGNPDMVIITDDEAVPKGKSSEGNSAHLVKTAAKDKKSAVPKADDSNIFTKPKIPKPLNTPVEVIDIEAIREKRMGSSDCVNPNCKSGSHLREAENFVTAYYNVKPKNGLRMCAECHQTAMNYADKLRNNLEKHKSIFDLPYNCDSLVVSLDLDSDDENEKEENKVNLKNKKLVKSTENYLNDKVMSVLEKYDYKFQLEEGSKKVTSEIDRIKAEFDSMRLEIKNQSKHLQSMYEKIHGPYRPRYTHLKEIEIVDCYVKPHGLKIPLKTPRSRSGSNFNPSGLQGTGLIKPPGQFHAPPPPRPAVAMKKVTPFKFSSAKENNSSSRNISSSDIVQLAPSRVDPPPNLPNQGPLLRTPIKPNEVVYFMKSTLYGVWIPGKVVKISAAEKKYAPFKFLYKIRPEPLKKYHDAYRSLLGKYIAYSSPANVRLPIGTRVIAIFKEENAKTRNDKFYAGVIAEPPKSINKFRYLVFFDDGYAQYINHEEIRVVCESSSSVWDDVLPDFKDFIHRYLSEYPERPMVKLQKKQMVKTEWNGKWWIARVMEIDSSLVKMLFDADRRVEWIYRGSTRLGPLFAAHKRQETGDRLVRGLNSNLRSRNLPYVEYTRQEYDGKIDNKDNTLSNVDIIEKRAVARKSGTGKPVFLKPSEREKKEFTAPLPIPQIKVPSRIDTINTSSGIKPKRFTPHQCGPKCVSWVEHTRAKGRGYGPLAVPLLFGFERVWGKVRANKGVIFYVAPCGRRLRNMSEVHRYLRITKSEVTVDQFSFEEWVNCLTEFKITKYFNYIEDISFGEEKQPISCVNYLDNLMPQYVHYITEREPRDGVPLNLDPDFLVCCDCTDDCQDKEKCSCWRLTMDNQKIIPGMDSAELNQGYIYRRLPERIVTGIYECNSRCKCSKTSCLNRVVQHPLEQKLQLFKTEKKGWGIRCLHDIPIGSFICIYAGHLLTENSANEEGKNYGDEYLAELDYIEVIERIKEDYEESVPSELLSEAEKSEASSNEDDGHRSSGSTSPRSKDADAKFEVKRGANSENEFRMMLRKKPDTSKKKKKKEDDKSSSDQDKSSSKDDDDDGDSDSEDRKGEGAPRKFNPVVDEDPEDDKSRENSLRNLFGEDECVYVMDAKTHGNIGRYLNHSCEPNVFVQNVFVDTQDLRFPWVAFFALNYIPAGQELTWDYNYDVNSVPGKVLYCYCHSVECRGRLL